MCNTQYMYDYKYLFYMHYILIPIWLLAMSVSYYYLEFQIHSKNSLRLGVHGTYFKLWILNVNINIEYEPRTKIELILND